MLDPLHGHALRGHDVELVDHARSGKPHRVMDVAYCERERCWHLLVVDLKTNELDVWQVTKAGGVRVLQPDSDRRHFIPHRNFGGRV